MLPSAVVSITTETCTPVVDGLPYIQWIYSLFGDCVYGWQECISLLLGYLSIFCWLNAQMPQVIKNYRLGDAESLSFSFLTVWLTGDIANFIGCIATHQLPFQLYLSIYFIIIDTILCFQYLYYVKFSDNRLRRWIHSRNGEEIKITTSAHDGTVASPILNHNTTEQTHLLNDHKGKSSYQSTKTLMMLGLFGFYYTTLNTTNLTTSSFVSPTVVSYDDTNDSMTYWMTNIDNDDEMLWMGRFFAWVCTFLYLSSRLPQIIKNFQRRSVEGLSMALFFFAACGNLTYVLSIFTNPHATRKSMLEAVPYLLGSAGTLCFDATIFGQYLAYNPHVEIENDIEQ
ncbi:PQ loop repeat-domain-containing protein [Halteromyces radiatus]|uniref:PQ loop repeat-domain-containing protein n=1 Tax=Halteromyces radiatus TaxID=101107 RepID=UPI002220AC38|nr:PQ loop repeat-domain-containing protein [Halteromyces radiatus]KAI8084455.1 PQ loop repeat-domain-containing protein [Halteromyces radiatus]